MSSEEKKEHGLKFYGRRKGKALRKMKTSAYEDVMPLACIPLPTAPLDPRTLFPFPVRAVGLEIGFGDGEHLLHQALNNPETGFIGCEPFINGIAALCIGIRSHALKNIRIFPDDARLLMARMTDQSIDRGFLLNSDPWPKTRHHKRRFIQKETLNELHRLLKPGAEFRMSSDHPGLTAWQLEKTCAHDGYEWMANCAADWRTRPADLPETRYQKKGSGEGRATVFLSFEKRG